MHSRSQAISDGHLGKQGGAALWRLRCLFVWKTEKRSGASSGARGLTAGCSGKAEQEWHAALRLDSLRAAAMPAPCRIHHRCRNPSDGRTQRICAPSCATDKPGILAFFGRCAMLRKGIFQQRLTAAHDSGCSEKRVCLFAFVRARQIASDWLRHASSLPHPGKLCGASRNGDA